MVMTKPEFKKTEDIKDYLVGAIIKYIEISEFSDLKIVFDKHVILQILADSMRFETGYLIRKSYVYLVENSPTF